MEISENVRSRCRLSAFFSIVLLAGFFAFQERCYPVNNPLRAGNPGTTGGTELSHTVVLNGTGHADGYCQPLQNCIACHGTDLKGGKNGEPSCFKCHGDKWAGGCGGDD